MSGEQYFVDHKKGEVNELQQMLRQKAKMDQKQKREVIKKVIAYMTLGIDVSRLFTDMMMAVNTRDLVIKKMVYQYLCYYAQTQQEQALLCINSLQKDCRDADPHVRGLALRSLCGLSVPSLREYIEDPLKQGLVDSSEYVRKIAACGFAKLWRMEPDVVNSDPEILDTLYNMLRDKSCGVVVNVIHSLNEILKDEGGMSINKAIINHLLGRFNSFNQWGKCAILELLSKYTPETESDIFDIMNIMEMQMNSSNSAVVLSAVKVFLKLTNGRPALQKQVSARVLSPLITLMGNPRHYIAYPVVAHIKMLVERYPEDYAIHYQYFFCRHNDPPVMKELKVAIMVKLAVVHPDPHSIITELSEYVGDNDEKQSRLAIKAIGKITLLLPEKYASGSIDLLLRFLDCNAPHITNETCVCLQNILRKFPSRAEIVLRRLNDVLKTVEETKAMVAAFWIMGSYGEKIPHAPYMLENYIDHLIECGNDLDTEVWLEMLTASLRLFFKRPPEMQKMLGRLLKAAAKHNRVVVRDRALRYYRLLWTDCAQAEKMIRLVGGQDVIGDEVKVDANIFDEFNSLSVIYGKPAASFVLGEKEDEEEIGSEDDAKEPIENVDEDVKESVQVTPAVPSPPPAAEEPDIMGDLLNFGTGAKSTPVFELLPDPKSLCDAAMFQQYWGQWSVQANENINTSQNTTGMLSRVVAAAQSRRMAMIASGNIQTGFKAYFTAADSDKTIYLVELIAQNNVVQATIKSTKDSKPVMDILKQIIVA